MLALEPALAHHLGIYRVFHVQDPEDVSYETLRRGAAIAEAASGVQVQEDPVDSVPGRLERPYEFRFCRIGDIVEAKPRLEFLVLPAPDSLGIQYQHVVDDLYLIASGRRRRGKLGHDLGVFGVLDIDDARALVAVHA
jgi:hypothetical protein